MKQCRVCNQTYTDDQLNFCLNDGELLTQMYGEPQQRPFSDDSPPTLVMNEARVTNPATWQPPSAPPAVWQGQQQQPNLQNPLFNSPRFVHSRDQTLPTISLILGILSMPLICCYGGIWLGLPAAIIGFLGMRNADSNSSQYGGRGMAIAGMVLGAVSFLISVAVGLIAILAR